MGIESEGEKKSKLFARETLPTQVTLYVVYILKTHYLIITNR